jgi:ATP-binding cassette subfamily B protein
MRSRRRLAGVLIGSGFRAAPWAAVVLLALNFVAAAASVCYSLGYKLVVDGALAHSSTRIVLGAALVAVLFSLSWSIAIVAGTQGSVLTDQANLALGMRIARLVARLPSLEHFERPDLLTRVEQVTGDRRTLAGATRQIFGLFGQLVRSVGIVVLLATVYLPVLVVPLLALAPALSDRLAARMQQRADNAIAEDRRLMAGLFHVATSADSARELRTYGLTEALIERHDALVESVRRRSVRAALLSALLEGIGWLIFALGVVGAIVVLVLRAAHGHVSPGDVVMAVSLMRRAQTQISRSTDTASAFNTAMLAARQLLWLEDYAASYEQPQAGAEPPIVPARLSAGIRFEDVEFAYGNSEEPVLGPLELELPAGSTVALVGENGAGKTTLVKLLTSMYRPRRGRILIDGTDLATLPAHAWREHVSAAFQDFQRLQFVLGESVGLGDIPQIEDHGRIRDALARADAGAIEQSLPEGLLTRVGTGFTGGRELSGGQWQRLALARGLMRDAPLLVVLDEPTASLDAPTETALFDRYMAAARKLGAAQGTITLLVSHRFSTVRGADLIVVLERGRVAETGTHEQLMTAGGTYAELFRLQASAYA